MCCVRAEEENETYSKQAGSRGRHRLTASRLLIHCMHCSTLHLLYAAGREVALTLSSWRRCLHCCLCRRLHPAIAPAPPATPAFAAAGRPSTNPTALYARLAPPHHYSGGSHYRDESGCSGDVQRPLTEGEGGVQAAASVSSCSVRPCLEVCDGVVHQSLNVRRSSSAPL